MSARKLLLAALAAAAAGCSSTENVRLRVVRPAVFDLGRFELVALDPFDGSGGPELAREISESLARARNALTGKAIEVLDRRQMERILAGVRGQQTAEWDPDVLAKLDRLRQAKVLVRGEVGRHGVEEHVEETSWCDETGVPHVTFVRRAVAAVDAMIEISEAATDKLLDRASFAGRVARSSQSVDVEPAPIDPELLLAQAREEIVGQFLRRVIPHEDSVVVSLFVDGDFPQLKLGNAQAAAGSWGDAIASYEQALDLMIGDRAEVRYKALYNLGVALQFTHRFEEARRALHEAYAVHEDERILRQLQNVAAREQEYRTLLEQAGEPASASAG